MHTTQTESDTAFSLRNLLELEAQRGAPTSELEGPETVRDAPEDRIKLLEEEIRQLQTVIELKDGHIRTLEAELSQAAEDDEPETERRPVPMEAVEAAEAVLADEEQPFTSLHHGFLNVAL